MHEFWWKKPIEYISSIPTLNNEIHKWKELPQSWLVFIPTSDLIYFSKKEWVSTFHSQVCVPSSSFLESPFSSHCQDFGYTLLYLTLFTCVLVGHIQTLLLVYQTFTWSNHLPSPWKIILTGVNKLQTGNNTCFSFRLGWKV